MSINLGKKLVAIADKMHIKFFEAEGVKITNKISEVKLDIDKNNPQNNGQGSFHKNSAIGGFYEPHTDPKELEGKSSAKNILEHIESILKSDKYREVILASSPKILGYLRKGMNQHLKSKISKEIDKDLIHAEISLIEKKIFAA